MLNLLEGMRTGLLKIGNQHYDFSGGRFVLSGSQPSDAARQSVAARWKSASSQPVTVAMLKPFAMPLAAAGLALTVLVSTYIFMLAPIEQRGATAANLYSNTLTRIAQTNLSGAKPVAAEPVLWARDMMALAAMMPYDMKLKRLALVQASGTAGASFELAGILPKGGCGQSATDRPVHETPVRVSRPAPPLHRNQFRWRRRGRHQGQRRKHVPDRRQGRAHCRFCAWKAGEGDAMTLDRPAQAQIGSRAAASAGEPLRALSLALYAGRQRRFGAGNPFRHAADRSGPSRRLAAADGGMAARPFPSF